MGRWTESTLGSAWYCQNMNTVAPLTQLLNFQEFILLPPFLKDVFARFLIIALFVIITKRKRLNKPWYIHAIKYLTVVTSGLSCDLRMMISVSWHEITYTAFLSDQSKGLDNVYYAERRIRKYLCKFAIFVCKQSVWKVI